MGKRKRPEANRRTEALVVVSGAGALELASDRDRVRETARESKAPRTLHEYTRALRSFAGWCQTRSLDPRPADPVAAADVVTLYLQHRFDAGRKRSTVEQDLAAIAWAYQDAGLSSPSKHPVVRAFVSALRRRYAARGSQVEQKAAATDRELVEMLGALPATSTGVRDRALLLIGWAGAFRRSELAALDRADVAEDRDGLVVTLRRSKTDQEGAGLAKAIPFGPTADRCPVRSLRAWLEPAAITEGPVFRAVDRHGHVSRRAMDPGSIARAVRRAATLAKLTAPQGSAGFSGHSLRAGFVTSAARRGCSEATIMAQTGHKSTMTLRGYIRRATPFQDNAAPAVVGMLG